MSDKKNSMMMLAQAIGGLNVMEPPEIPNDQSWLPRKLTKGKIRDINEMSKMMAETYENNTRALGARISGAITLLTASARLKNEFEILEHESKMRNFAEMKEQAQVIQEQSIAKKLNLECEVLELEIKDLEFNFKQKEREYAPANENRD